MRHLIHCLPKLGVAGLCSCVLTLSLSSACSAAWEIFDFDTQDALVAAQVQQPTVSADHTSFSTTIPLVLQADAIFTNANNGGLVLWLDDGAGDVEPWTLAVSMSAWAPNAALGGGDSSTIEITATHEVVPTGGFHDNPLDARTRDEFEHTPNAQTLSFELNRNVLFAQEAAVAQGQALGPQTILQAAVFPQQFDYHGSGPGHNTSGHADVLRAQLLQDGIVNDDIIDLTITLNHRFVPIPEPSGLLLAVVAVLSLCWASGRRSVCAVS